MSGEFVDQSSKADVTPTILKQLIEDAEDQDNLIQVRKADCRVSTTAELEIRDLKAISDESIV
jgi:hypothetical protein